MTADATIGRRSPAAGAQHRPLAVDASVDADASLDAPRAARKPPDSPLAARGPLDRPLASVVDDSVGDWWPLVDAWRESATGRALMAHVDARLAAGAVVYPASPLRALRATQRAAVQVIVVGQDPYHGPGQADGLAFSVQRGLRFPPSLRNIFRERERDLGVPPPSHGDLSAWADRGVLLLNSALTVEDGQPGAHAGRGWEALTDAVVASAATDARPKVFLLWGTHARQRLSTIAALGVGRHLVLVSNHPSPLSATRGAEPFLGNGHFRASARFLDVPPHALWALDP